MNDITERFVAAYEYLKKENLVFSPKAFAKEINVSTSLITEICKDRTNAGITPIQNLVTAYPIFNANWLLTGKEKMLNEISFNDSILSEQPEVYKLKTDRIEIDQQAIPLYNIEATAGIVTLFSDSSQSTPIDYIKIPNLPKCDGALYITGDSMYPLLKSGDIVMYKQIINILEGIFWGEMYLVSIDQDGDEMVLVKYIQKSSKGDDWIRLVSQNQHHQEKDIKISKIRALALIKASIRISSMS